jgi:hypothetical protein
MTDAGANQAEDKSKTDGGEELAIEISVHPTSRTWLSFAGGFLMYAIIAAILPLLLLHWYFVGTPEGETPIWVYVAVGLICAGGAFWFVRRSADRLYWRLTDTHLIAGSAGHTRYPLESIEKIILGLPRELGGTPAHKSEIQERKSVDAYLQASALLVIFQDGSMLPLRIRFLENGTALTKALTERYHHLVVQDYKYSESEIAALKKSDPNQLVLGVKKPIAAPPITTPTVSASSLPTPVTKPTPAKDAPANPTPTDKSNPSSK